MSSYHLTSAALAERSGVVGWCIPQHIFNSDGLISSYDFENLVWRNPYYRDRWEYYGEVVKIIRKLNKYHLIYKTLELGPGEAQIVKKSDIMDVDKDISLLPSNNGPKTITKFVKYIHDATITPWPIKDKEYDLFIALQVWEHLEWRQQEAFREVMRVSKMAILSFPYKWDKCPKEDFHYGIDDEKIAEWTLHIRPIATLVTGDSYKRKIYLFVFDEKMKNLLCEESVKHLVIVKK